MASVSMPKHVGVYRQLLDAIDKGDFPEGARIPPEVELGARYGVSRPTIARALVMLEQEGRLVRRRGAGTFIRPRTARSEQLLALVAPSVERGGTFDRLCTMATNSAKSAGYSVILGGSVAQPDEIDGWALSLSGQLLAHRVRGALFLPMELPAAQTGANMRIAQTLQAAGIPTVLIDRDICEPPERSQFDIVGIDNRRAGHAVTTHLVQLGLQRIHFLSHPMSSSSSVRQRIEGYRAALRDGNITAPAGWVHEVALNEDPAFLPSLMHQAHPEGFVCVNDHLARDVLYQLGALGIRVPADVRIVSIDDLPFAQHGPVRLTTLQQPVEAIGANAVAVLLSRIADPSQPPRDIHIACRLIVRESCGAQLQSR